VTTIFIGFNCLFLCQLAGLFNTMEINNNKVVKRVTITVVSLTLGVLVSILFLLLILESADESHKKH